MHIKILTPDRLVFEGDVSSVKFPGSKGEFEVLKDHAAIISTLRKGNLRLRTSTGDKYLLIDGGVVEVLNNEIIVLAESVKEN
ncbi:MAG: ATP synthase F1 subunit epsilon [Microscillaceae bacterium]|nr:ATP synthase F1 subunit epsilon [Microscillaceae bacterium]